MAIDVLKCDLVEQLVDAEDLPQAWSVMRDIVHSFGFDNLIFGTNRLRGAGMFGEKSDTFFISDLPESFMVPFWEHELYRTTPIVVWAMENTGVQSLKFFGDQYHDGTLPEALRSTQEILTMAGASSGYVIAFNKAGLPIAAALALVNFGKSHEDTEAIWRQHGREIHAYANIFQLKAAGLPVPLAARKLTKRQNEVLRWVGAGKTTAEAATILGLSPATIEKHLRQVRDTLGVSTTTQAVLHAQINGHIFHTEK